MEWLADPDIWLALVTLTTLEIVLGIDNLVFLTILVDRLPRAQRPMGRRLGLGFALVTRLLLLSMLAWIVRLTEPLFVLFEHAVSWRDIILIAGGLFLLAKATHEIHGSLEGPEDEADAAAAASAAAPKVSGVAVAMIAVQIGILDIIFSLDSVITAVGMADQLWVMITAVCIAIVVMLFAAGPLGAFISAHPTVKMLALAFLLLVGMALVAEGMGMHIPKGYLYFAMGFSVMVEALNIAARRRRGRKPVRLRTPVP